MEWIHSALFGLSDKTYELCFAPKLFFSQIHVAQNGKCFAFTKFGVISIKIEKADQT